MAKKPAPTARKPPRPAIPAATAAPGAARPSSLLDTRVIYCGDCLEQLQKLPPACIDLIYIDPPFNSNRNYEVFWGETKEKRAFEDRHESTQAYIDYMRPRCVQLARVLKKTGSFYYHCDWHASHYVKVMLDQIMGENNFQSEVIWKRTGTHSSARKWGPIHDSIFFYAQAEGEHTWNRPYAAHDEKHLSRHYRLVDDDGRRYEHGELTAPGTRNGRSGMPWRGFDVTKLGRHWTTTIDNLEKMFEEGQIYLPDDGSWPRVIRYMDESKGRAIGDVWTDIPPLNMVAKERLGYPTQKPLALLDRIINASSNPNEIVLDAFCGCGTALVAAQNLNRQWIGLDISPTACRVMAKRLKDVCHMRESEPGHRARDPKSFIVRDLPWTIAKLRAIPPFEFENWAVIALGGIPNKVQVGDMGIDGRIFPVGTKPADDHSMFAGDWFPIQVKQHDKVGRPDIDSFEAVMEREDRQRGFIVAFGFSGDAEAECRGFHRRTGRIIKLITVQEILDEQHVEKM
ncbi:MAG: DNA methyltransferase [Phycisphaerales bacterium]